MKKHEYPDTSFLNVDIRLLGPLISILCATLFMDVAPGALIPCVLVLLFCLLRLGRWKPLIALSLIFLVLQSVNLWVRGLDDYLSDPSNTWRAKVIGESNTNNQYVLQVIPENPEFLQQPVKAIVKFKTEGPEVGDSVQLTGRLTHDKFGFNIKNPSKIAIEQQHNSRLIAHERIRDALQHRSSDTEIGLFLGITYGDDTLIENEDEDNFRAVGITHMTAVSGSNIAMVAATSFSLLALLIKHRRPALFGTIVITFAYCTFVGLDGSVLRAFIFALLGFFSAVSGGTKNALGLCLSALILLLLVQPLLLWDVGFVLSASVTLGLVILCQPLTFLLTAHCGELLAVFLSANIVAHLVSTPISAFYFEKIYTYSFIANVLVAPLVPVILALGIIYLFVYVFYGYSADLFLHLAHPLLFGIEKLSAALARSSGSVLEIHNGVVLFVLVLISVATSCIIVRSGRRKASEIPEPVILI